MLKEEIKKRNISIKQIQKISGIPYTTLNDLINGRTDIDNVGVRVLVALSEALNISIDATYQICKKSQPIKDCRIEIKNKEYYLAYNGGFYRMCKVNNENTEYLYEIATMTLSDIKRQEQMERWI